MTNTKNMNSVFLTKIEVARLIANQFDVPDKIKNKVALKLVRLHEADLLRNVIKSGFVVEYFGYGRWFIK
jgi:hypothetical protein